MRPLTALLDEQLAPKRVAVMFLASCDWLLYVACADNAWLRFDDPLRVVADFSVSRGLVLGEELPDFLSATFLPELEPLPAQRDAHHHYWSARCGIPVGFARPARL